MTWIPPPSFVHQHYLYNTTRWSNIVWMGRCLHHGADDLSEGDMRQTPLGFCGRWRLFVYNPGTRKPQFFKPRHHLPDFETREEWLPAFVGKCLHLFHCGAFRAVEG